MWERKGGPHHFPKGLAVQTCPRLFSANPPSTVQMQGVVAHIPSGVQWQNLVALQSWQPPLEGAGYWGETQSQFLSGCLLLRHLGPYSPRDRKETMNNLLEKYLFNCKAFTVEVPAWV